LSQDTLPLQHRHERRDLVGVRDGEFLEGDEVVRLPALLRANPPSIPLHAVTQIPERQLLGLSRGVAEKVRPFHLPRFRGLHGIRPQNIYRADGAAWERLLTM
jgi:hypothetical protein